MIDKTNLKLHSYRTIPVDLVWPELFMPIIQRTKIEVAEFKPQRRTIKVLSGEKKDTYCLPFPYMQFIRVGEKMGLTFSNEPIQSVEDETYFPALPNVYGQGMVCMACDDKEPIQQSVMRFWNTSFFFGNGWKGLSLVRYLHYKTPHIIKDSFMPIVSAYHKWEQVEDAITLPWSERLIIKDVIQALVYPKICRYTHTSGNRMLILEYQQWMGPKLLAILNDPTVHYDGCQLNYIPESSEYHKFLPKK